MDASPSALFKFLVPKTPFLLKTALWHSLSLSETSSKWDLRTELTVRVLRQVLGPDSPTSSVTKQQRLTTKDPGVKGRIWVSKVKYEIPNGDGRPVKDIVFKAIEDLSGTHGPEPEQWPRCDSVPLEAEWVGARLGPDVKPDTPEPHELSESEKYAHIVRESTNGKLTILYFHGGAMFLLDPATYRQTTGKLARKSGGKVFAVRYRLSPQNPFPAALLDAFTSYLTLLYPPPGSDHEAVEPGHIVFAGDSAGGMLASSLLQLLLQIRRSAPEGHTAKVNWYGNDVEIPLPAGSALVSPWLDVTRSLPSIEANAKFDYLPPPSHTATMQYPKCEAWPTDPPRADLYCEGSAMLHPLVSPLVAKNWEGSPPVFFSVGQEMLRDEDAVLAKRLNAQGVTVVWREFESMPHVFAYMLESLPASKLHFEEFIDFCKKVTGGNGGSGGGGGVQSSAQTILAKSLERQNVEFEKITDLSDEVVLESLQRGKTRLEEKAKGSGSVEARPML